MEKKGWWDIVRSSYVWKSVFRHEYQDTYRNRVLQVSSNVFLHLHPTKIRRHALRLRFTWCMGGMTFLLFLILVVTGVILMFYYRPTGEYAYHDMKYLQFDVPFGMIMRNMHRWAAHAMVIAVCSLALSVDRERGEARAAFGSAAPVPTLVTGELDGFAERVAAAASPIDDVRGSAAYRRHALRVLASRAIERCLAA